MVLWPPTLRSCLVQSHLDGQLQYLEKDIHPQIEASDEELSRVDWFWLVNAIIRDFVPKSLYLLYVVDLQLFSIMGLIELPILLGCGVAIAIFISRSNQQKRLESAFYQLLRQQDSCISLIQLMAISQVSSERAKTFLDRQIRLLDGIPEVEEDGDTFYRFPKLLLPDLLTDDGW